MRTLNQNALAIIATDLAAANKKSVIRVLHVDDDPSILEITKDIMLHMNSNFEFDSACCVAEAFKKLATEHYNIVVSDHEIPKKDGLEFLKELKQQKNKIPFILFTGKGREEVAIKALNLGVDGYYNKQGSPETVYGELCHGIIQVVKRNRAEKAQEKIRFLSLIVEDSDDAIIGKTLNGSITSWNKSAERIYGYNEDEALGESIQMLAPPEEKEEITQILKKIGAGEPIKRYQTKRVRKDGVIIDVSLSISPIKNDAGTIIGALTIARDITEYKKVKELAIARLERYQSFIDITGELGWTTNAAGEVLEDIPSFRNFTGQTYDEIKGWGWLRAVHPDDASAAKLAWQTAVAKKTKYEVEYRLRRFDGVYRNFMARGVPIFIEGEIFEWVGTCIDITERKKAEKTLLESEHLLAESGRIGKVGGWKINIDTNKLTWTDETYHIHEVDHNFKPTIENEVRFYTSESRIIMEQAVQQAIEHGKSFDLELQITTAKGNIRSVRVIGEVNIENRVVEGFLQDITERKKAEERIKESSAKIEMINEKLHVVDHLTIHDSLNKLGVIVGQTYLLNEKYKDYTEIVYRLGKIRLACSDIETIFNLTKIYEQIGVEELTCISVAEKLEEAVALFSEPIPTIINECHGLTVLADSFLRQLFYNFIENTRRYGKKTTTIRVYFEKTDQDCLKLIYEDDGAGIPLENKQSLFKEGFSTGGSTGFGLFLTKKMIDVYGWTITEEGEPGKGAKFVMTITKLNKNGKENYQITW